METSENLTNLYKAIESLKRYQRSDVQDSSGESLVPQLYVDPLRGKHVLNTLKAKNTTLLIGRKGTGKSTVFLNAQREISNDRRSISAYIDIKTVWETSSLDGESKKRISSMSDALPPEVLERSLLLHEFFRAVISGIKDDITSPSRQGSLWQRIVDPQVRVKEISRKLDRFLESLSDPDFVSAQLIRVQQRAKSTEIHSASGASVHGNSLGLAGFTGWTRSHETDRSNITHPDLSVRVESISTLIREITGILSEHDISNLYIFVDDFSELPEDAMRHVVDNLIAPLNNNSQDMIKFKIACYPSRIHLGTIDPSKIDQINLDMFDLYGDGTAQEMEEKATEFTRRLVQRRFEVFKFDASEIFDPSDNELWRALFFASMGNARTLGYILLYIYKDAILYGKRVSESVVKAAAQRYYEENIAPYFKRGTQLQMSYEERASVFALNDLLKSLVAKAKQTGTSPGLLHEDPASSLTRRSSAPSSHFHISSHYEKHLRTLEHNFFITKYHELKDKSGARVTVYALNYGLAASHTIGYGRPPGRNYRNYFVLRPFNYTALIESHLYDHQRIVCESCGHEYPNDELEMLTRYDLACYICKSGVCKVTNGDPRHVDALESIPIEALLPPVEFDILQALPVDGEYVYLSELMEELDLSKQLAGRRASMLQEKELVHRDLRNNRRILRLTEKGRAFREADTPALI